MFVVNGRMNLFFHLLKNYLKWRWPGLEHSRAPHIQSIRHTVLLLLLIYFTQLIRILFFDCSVEEDGAVAGVRISGEDESVLDNSAIVDATTLPEAKNQMPSSLEMSGTGKTTVKRKYHDSYLDTGFVETNDNKPQCVICGKVLRNSAMSPAKMRRHF